MKQLFLLSLAISPLMLSAELIEETIAALDFEEEQNLVEEQEVTYLSDNHAEYFKRSARSVQVDDDDDDSEQEYQPRYRPKSRSAVADEDSTQGCPKPKSECMPPPECKPKPKCPPKCKPEPKCPPKCPPKCKPEPMYKTVTKQVRCYPPTKQIPEPCCCLMYPSAHESMIQKEWNMKLFAEWLYLQVHEEGLSFTESFVFNGNPPVGTRLPGITKSPDIPQPSYHSGFRIGIDGEMCYDHWDVLVEWTSFHQNSSYSDAVTGVGNVLAPTLFQYQAGAPGCGNADASWKFTYDVLDFLLGRDFYAGEHLFLKPRIGARLGFTRQTLTVDYFNFLEPVPWSIATALGKQHFQGYGVDVGIDGRWMFSKSFGLYSTVDASLLWGLYKNKFQNSVDTFSPPILISNYTIKNLQSILGVSLGLKWEKFVAHDTYYVSCQAGWEGNLWWNHNRMFESNSAGILQVQSSFTTSGNLALSGLAVRFTFGF